MANPDRCASLGPTVLVMLQAPLTPMFAEGDLTIAIHARRGDIVNTTNAASRWTADTVYQTVLDQLLDMICRPEVVGRRRLLVNIFSEGREVRASRASSGHARADVFLGAPA